jgi:hypothetical protein
MIMNRARKEKVKEQLDRLDQQEHGQIFAIIKRYTDNFTKTETGALVSTDTLPDECIIEVEKMVAFYLDQRKRMDADVLERKGYERR